MLCGLSACGKEGDCGESAFGVAGGRSGIDDAGDNGSRGRLGTSEDGDDGEGVIVILRGAPADDKRMEVLMDPLSLSLTNPIT